MPVIEDLTCVTPLSRNTSFPELSGDHRTFLEVSKEATLQNVKLLKQCCYPIPRAAPGRTNWKIVFRDKVLRKITRKKLKNSFQVGSPAYLGCSLVHRGNRTVKHMNDVHGTKSVRIEPHLNQTYICHHKQCLCKIISAPEKNLFSVNSKTFVVLLEELVFYVKKMQILKELWCLDAEIGVF